MSVIRFANGARFQVADEASVSSFKVMNETADFSALEAALTNPVALKKVELIDDNNEVTDTLVNAVVTSDLFDVSEHHETENDTVIPAVDPVYDDNTGELIEEGKPEEVIPGEDKLVGYYAAVTLRTKTQTELRLDALEASQDIQDGAIADLADVIAEL